VSPAAYERYLEGKRRELAAAQRVVQEQVTEGARPGGSP
jgi:hypothetical protein